MNLRFLSGASKSKNLSGFPCAANIFLESVSFSSMLLFRGLEFSSFENTIITRLQKPQTNPFSKASDVVTSVGDLALAKHNTTRLEVAIASEMNLVQSARSELYLPKAKPILEEEIIICPCSIRNKQLLSSLDGTFIRCLTLTRQGQKYTIYG